MQSNHHIVLRGRSWCNQPIRCWALPEGGGTLYHPIMKKKILINPDSGGASRTIKANYYKSGIANFIRTDGRAANAVLIITKL